MLYRGIYRFCAIFGRFGGMAAFSPRGSASEVMAPRPRLTRMCVMCIPTEFKGDIFTDNFQKMHANSPLHRQIISQIQTKPPGVGVEAV